MFKRRFALGFCLVSSLIVALLWGLNISAVFPLVEVIFDGQGAVGYVQSQAAETQRLALEKREEYARLENRSSELSEQIAQMPPDSEALQPSQAELSGLKWEMELADAAANAYQRSADTLNYLQPFAERYLPVTPFGTLLLVVVFLIAITTIKLSALTVNTMLVQDLSNRAAMQIREQFFRKALRQDLENFGESGSANLTSRLTGDVTELAGGLIVVLGRMILEPLKMIVCLVGAGLICWRLLLLTFIVAPVVGFIIQSLSRSIRRSSRRVMEEMSLLHGLLSEAFAGIRVVRAYNTEAHQRARFKRGAQEYYRKSMKVAFYNSASRFATEALGTTVICIGLLAGGYLVLNHEVTLFGIRMSDTPLSVPEMILFFGLLIGASDPARKLSDVWSTLQRGIAAAERLMEVIDAPIRVREPAKPKTVSRPHGSIAIRRVNFQYPAGPPVLKELDLEIPHGETWAIVGPNGSGKSTLVSLLCRFYDPQSGQVEMDGITLPEMRTRDLRRRIGLVTQKTVVFEDTILSNILYGTPGASREDAIRAAQQAYADEFIQTKTPHGYDTVIGNNGIRLSGGQMQRIALARAFLRDPDILILDEATSQIDMESESLIHDALATYLVGRTGIMITHRPTTLALADKVAVMEGGRVVDSGTFQQLVARNRFFQSLVSVSGSKAA